MEGALRMDAFFNSYGVVVAAFAGIFAATGVETLDHLIAFVSAIYIVFCLFVKVWLFVRDIEAKKQIRGKRKNDERKN